MFEARVVGLPLPQIEWLKEGKALDNYRIRTEHDAQTGICLLTVPQQFGDDLGEYTCRATNTMGQTDSSAHIMERT